MKCALVGGKVYVAWKHKMFHDVTLHDVIGGHQAICSKKEKKMWHPIFQLAKTTRGSRAALTRQDYKLSLLGASRGTMNNRGPRMDPCGTLEVMASSSDD